MCTSIPSVCCHRCCVRCWIGVVLQQSELFCTEFFSKQFHLGKRMAAWCHQCGCMSLCFSGLYAGLTDGLYLLSSLYARRTDGLYLLSSLYAGWIDGLYLLSSLYAGRIDCPCVPVVSTTAGLTVSIFPSLSVSIYLSIYLSKLMLLGKG